MEKNLYCLIGNPIEHSLSPLMHNLGFKETNYNGIYIPFLIKENELEDFFKAFKLLNIKGASITIPHKINALKFVDEISDDALKIGSINTILNEDGKIKAFNSDVIGAIKSLKEKTKIKDKDIFLIGAGGSARAISYGLIKEEANLVILNRNIKKGEELAKELNASFLPLSDKSFQNNIDILINTTPLGMHPHIDNSPIKKKYLNKNMIIMDIIYNPLETKLLKDAKEVGAETINGLSMFIYQGSFQFELWTKLKFPLEYIKKKISNL